MDQRLLEALNNLSFALEEISIALSEKSGKSESATTKALQSGNFTEQIAEINVSVKEIKKDTQEILKNQKTIMSMASSKKDDDGVEQLGKDRKSQDNFKSGIAVIMLIAVAVLALGVAFKMIGDINILSVLTLAIALPLLAIAFERVHNTLKKVGFDPKKDSTNFIVAVTSIAMGITLSSWILTMVTPLSFSKFFTTVALAGMFALLAPSIGKFIGAFKGMSWSTLIKSVLGLTLILPAIAMGIALSSWALQLIKPIGLPQFFTAVGIGLVFVVLAYGLKKLLKSFSGLNPAASVQAAIMLPFILPAVSLAMALSSEFFNQITPIDSLAKFMTAVGIALVFSVISYGIKNMIGAFKNVNPIDAAIAAGIMVFLLPAMSKSIAWSSKILANTTTIGNGLLWNIIKIGFTLGLVTIAMLPAYWAISKFKIGFKDVLVGGLMIVAISTAIMLSSWVLSVGKYEKYPSLKWTLGVGLALLLFTPAVVALGLISMTGVGALALLAGAGMTLVVAGTIVATSFILNKGKYSGGPTVGWSLATGLALVAFTTGMVALGTLIIGTFGLGAAVIAAGSAAVLMVAETIAKTSYVLKKGDYTGGPTKEWAGGIALALGAFSPVFIAMTRGGIMTLFTGGAVKSKDFSDAIKTISDGIVTAAKKFKGLGGFTGGPTKEWSEGVGIAIAAFSPAFEILNNNSKWWKKKVDPSQMKTAIIALSEGIIESAKIFNNNKVAFNGFYPSKEWAEGVGGAIGAFSPVFDNIKDKTFKNTKAMVKAITSIAKGIVGSAKILFDGNKYFGVQIDPKFIKKMSGNIMDYHNLINSLNDKKTVKGLFHANPITQATEGMVKIANAYDRLSRSIKNFSNAINTLNPIKVRDFNNITRNLSLISAMDASMYNRMLSVLEKRSGVFSKIGESNNRITPLEGIKSTKTTKDDNRLVKQPYKDSKGHTSMDKFDRMINLLEMNLAETKTINEYLLGIQGNKNSDF
jgi:hypothetical protein